LDFETGNVIISKVKTATKPEAVAEAALCIIHQEAGRHVVLLYGGGDETTAFDRFFIFSGSDWSEVQLKEGVLGKRKGHACVILDDMSVVYYGGRDEKDNYYSDLILLRVNHEGNLGLRFEVKEYLPNDHLTIEYGREGHEMRIFNNEIYVTGGCNRNTKKCYDGEINKLNIHQEDRRYTLKPLVVDSYPQNQPITIFKLYNQLAYMIQCTECTDRFNLVIQNVSRDCLEPKVSKKQFNYEISCHENTNTPMEPKLSSIKVLPPYELGLMAGTYNQTVNNSSNPAGNDSNPIPVHKKKKNQAKELKQIVSEMLRSTNHTSEINFLVKKEQETSLKQSDLSHNITELKDVLINTNHKSEDIANNLNSIMSLLNNIHKESTERIEKLEKRFEIECLNGHYNEKNQSCMCFPGFTGQACELSEQCNNNCTENGICRFGKCFCHPGFSGESCNTQDPCPVGCSSRGKCAFGKCFCDAGFTGTDCSIKLKCPNDCSTQGICFREKCLCEPGYSGLDCGTVDKALNNCKECKNGFCKFDKCFCYPGYTGKHCEIKNEFTYPPSPLINPQDYTPHKPCNDNGICKYGMCFCFPGFKGEDCGIREICKNNCSNNGLCVEGRCVCMDAGNKNDDCSEYNENLQAGSKPLEMKFKQVEVGELRNNSNSHNVSNGLLEVDFKEEFRKLKITIFILIIFIIAMLSAAFLFNRKK
jgi:hypothetical protein